MLVTPLVLIQIFSKRMLVDWPKCGSDPQDEGHLACLRSQTICMSVTGAVTSQGTVVTNEGQTCVRYVIYLQPHSKADFLR